MEYFWDCEKGEDVKLELSVRKETEKKFYTMKYLKQLNMKYELKDLGKNMATMKDTEEELKKQLKEKTAQDHNNGYLFITINPKENIKLDHFLKKVIKFIHRNFCDEASAVLNNVE